MKLVRYQNPEDSTWPALDRWSNLRDELNSLFDLPLLTNLNHQDLFSGWSPALDLYQNNDNLVAVVELPGMRKEDIEISFQEDTLTIAGERKSTFSNNEKAERTERYIGNFRRSITLPARVDSTKVSATYRDGILTVTLPKAEDAKPKRIQVTT